MCAVYFNDGEAVGCDIALETLQNIWLAVSNGHMEARIYMVYRSRRILFDVRYLDPHKTFLPLRKGAA